MAPPVNLAGPRLSDLEKLMWELEGDPKLSATYANLSIFETSPDLERLRRRMTYASAKIPRFRMRLDPGERGRWHPDPDFDIANHVRKVELPPPGTDAQLYELAIDILSQRFDGTQPLWDFVIIDGLGGERSAMLQKLHHVITDGEGGLRLAELMVDLEADAPEPEQVEPRELITPDAPSLVADTIGTVATGAIDVLKRLSRPSELPAMGIEATNALRSAMDQVVASSNPGSSLWRHRGGPRHLHTLQMPFDDCKEAAEEHGATLNDLFVTAAARATTAYHRRRNRTLASVHMAMPISTRKGGGGGNSFLLSRVDVPAGEPASRRHVRAVHERLVRTKSDPTLELFDNVLGALSRAPGPAVRGLVRLQAATIDLAISNVRGAPVDLYFAGARMVANYPMGPLAGLPANLTMMSNRGNLDVGIVTDSAAIERPQELRDDLADAFAELLS